MSRVPHFSFRPSVPYPRVDAPEVIPTTDHLPLPWCHSQPRNPLQFPAALPDHSLARWSKKIPFLGVEKQGMGPEAASQGVILGKEEAPTRAETCHRPEPRSPFMPVQLQEDPRSSPVTRPIPPRSLETHTSGGAGLLQKKESRHIQSTRDLRASLSFTRPLRGLRQ